MEWLAQFWDCDFLLDYEEEEDAENSNGRQKKKPWHLRWGEETHDEVLARLLDLNQQRAEAETLGGKVADKSKGKGNTKNTAKKGGTRKKEADASIPGLQVT